VSQRAWMDCEKCGKTVETLFLIVVEEDQEAVQIQVCSECFRKRLG
jgi:hypothetical protein